MHENERPKKKLIWTIVEILLLIAAVALFCIMVADVCGSETARYNPVTRRTEITQSDGSNKRYLYKNRWTDRIEIKDAATHETLETWEYNLFLDRWETKERR